VEFVGVFVQPNWSWGKRAMVASSPAVLSFEIMQGFLIFPLRGGESPGGGFL